VYLFLPAVLLSLFFSSIYLPSSLTQSLHPSHTHKPTLTQPDGTFDPDAMALAQDYLTACEHLVSYHSGVLAKNVIENDLGLGPVPAGKSLQEFAIEYLLEKGVTCVLLGCRNQMYVQDAIMLNGAWPSVGGFVRE
jgi:hypothetical protein